MRLYLDESDIPDELTLVALVRLLPRALPLAIAFLIGAIFWIAAIAILGTVLS